MSQEKVFLRYASPCERRMISREDLGFYTNIVVGAVYEFQGVVDLRSAQTFAGPLQHCVDKFPHLKVLVRDASTEKPYFERATSLDLQNHLTAVAGPADDDARTGNDHPWMEKVIEPLLDQPNSIASIPPWRVVVCPMAPPARCCFVAFAYSHIIGDGLAALAFHRAFLHGLRRQQKIGGLPQPIETPPLRLTPFTLPDPFDTPGRLPVSWPFLLGPLLAVLLPKFVANWLGLQASAAKVDAGTWTGSRVFFEPGAHRSRVKMFAVEDARVAEAIRASRAHDAKLTGTIHQLVVRALSKHITANNDLQSTTTSFVSQTAVSMRASIGLPREEWGNYASGCYGTHPVIEKEAGPPSSSCLPASMWAHASSLSKAMAESATQLQDNPLGLLRYAPSIRKWLLGKVGGRRDCSYEVSNLTSFDDKEEEEEQQQQEQEQEEKDDDNVYGGGGCRITKMVFAQPGGVVSGPMAFNLVSVRGGPLLGTITWGQGALGVPVEAEDALIDGIRRSLVDDFAGLSSS